MVKSNKIQSLIGFALKSGKIIFGTDNILSYRGREYLIIYDFSLSENARKKIDRHAEAHGTPVRLTDNLLTEIVRRDAVKAAALTDPNMAAEILKILNAER